MLGAVLSGPPQRPLVEWDRGRTVPELRCLGKGPYHVLDVGLAPGAVETTYATVPHGKAHGSVDAREDPGQLPLAPDQHDAPDARGPPRNALGNTDELHAIFKVPGADAVVSGTELVANFADLGVFHSQPREGPEYQGGCLIVTLPYPPPRIPAGTNDGEAEGPFRGSRSAPARAPHQDWVALLVGRLNGLAEAGTVTEDRPEHCCPMRALSLLFVSGVPAGDIP